MECDRILELLPGHLDGSLEELRDAEVESHLRDCARCSAEEEALRETLALLKTLPPEKAPPELLEGVRRRIAAEPRSTAAGKGLFASARVRIPLEAAAAVLLLLLVYGIQKQIPVTDRPAAPPARMQAESPAGKTKAEPAVPLRRDPNPPLASRTPAMKPAPKEPAARRSPEAANRTAEAPQVGGAPLPAVQATRVSTGAEPVAPRGREEERAEAPAPFRVFAEPPARLLRPLPFGREVTLEVDPGQRPGIEERIVRLVEGFGGSIRREWHFHGSSSDAVGGAPVPEGPMRVQIPADSAEAFLTELRKLGTIPSEGIPESADLPAGPAPELVAYTVRIRVR